MLILETMILAATLASPLPQGCGHSGHSDAPQRHAQAEPDTTKVRATNTICPVMGNAVKPGRDREVVVGGEYYLVCCESCGPEMAEHRDKYLDKDGRPKNSPKEPPKPKTGETDPPQEHKH